MASLNIGSVFVGIEAKAQQFMKGISGAQSSMKGMADKMKKHQATFRATGMAMTAMGGAIVGALGVATKSAASFEMGMAKVATLLDTSQVNMEELAVGLRQIGRQVPQDLGTLTEAMYQALSASVPLGESLEFVDQAARLATAGFTDTATAVDVLSTIMNAYGDEVGSVVEVSDILINTQNKGKTTVALMANSLGRVIPVAANAGIKLQDLSAALATMTAGGITTDEAITALRATILSYIKPTGKASAAAKDMGLNLSVTHLKSVGLIGAMQELAKAAGQDTEKFAQLFPNVRALTGALTLGGRMGGKYAEILRSMANASGETERAFEKLRVTTENQMASLKNQIEELSIVVGNIMLPSVNKALSKVADLVSGFADWAQQNPQLSSTLVVVSGIIGSLLLVLGPLVIFLPQIVAGFALLGPAIASVGGVIAGINLPILALAALVSGLFTNLFGVRDLMVGVFKWLGEQVLLFVKSAVSHLGWLLDIIGVDVDKLRGSIQEMADKAGESASESFGQMKDEAVGDWKAIKDAFTFNFFTAEDSVEKNTKIIVDKQIQEFKKIPSLLETTARHTRKVIQAETKVFSQIQVGASKEIFEGQANALTDVLFGDAGMLDAFGAFGIQVTKDQSAVISAIQGDWKSFAKWYVSKMLVGMLTGTKDASGGIGAMFGGLVSGIKGLFGGGGGGKGVEGAAGQASGILGGLTGKLGGIGATLGTVGSVLGGVGIAVGAISIGKKVLGSLFGKRDVNKYTADEEEEAYYIIGTLLGLDVPQGNAKAVIRGMWKSKRVHGRTVHDWFKKYWQSFVDKYGSRKGGQSSKEGAVAWLQQQMERDGIIDKSLSQGGGQSGSPMMAGGTASALGTFQAGGGGGTSVSSAAQRIASAGGGGGASLAGMVVNINNPQFSDARSMDQLTQRVGERLHRLVNNQAKM